MSKKKFTKRVSQIANAKMIDGKVRARCSLFYDRNGNPIPNSEVIEEVNEGFYHFQSKRIGSHVTS